ncbi:MAG: lytic transglycosylase domain-containing protein [Rhodospirillales bacterium]|nr:lytic transglycosylase domain-containing protein [Rhodospirillales bacterium]
MKAAGIIALATLLTIAVDARAAVAAPVTPATIQSCILAAANLHREPPALLLILLNVEGGTLGAVSQNTNGTVDIGPMQVNQIWVPMVAAHWNATKDATYQALRDNFCANVEAGAWILRKGLDEAHGDLWGGVAFYHSHNPVYQQQYMLSVLKQALRLEALPQKKSNNHLSALNSPAGQTDRRG